MKNRNKLAVIITIILVLMLEKSSTITSLATLQNNKGDVTVSTKLENISKSVDVFVYEVMYNSYSDYIYKNDTVPNSSQFKKETLKVYNGKLTNEVKSIIAAENANDYKWEYLFENDPVQIGTTSYSMVQKKARDIFGSSLTTIELPVWENRDSIDDFIMDLAKNKENEVYASSYEAENNVESKIIDCKKNKNGRYTITKEFYYYTHWSHEEPDYTVTAIIKIKKNSKSSYSYNITSLSIK